MSLLKRELITLLFIVLATAASIVFLMKQNVIIGSHVSARIPEDPVPTIIVSQPIENEHMDSPDGEKTLSMDRQQVGDNAAYSFFTSENPDFSKKLIFTKEMPSNETMSIPYNAWAPDNEYVFLKESTENQNNYYVVHNEGNAFVDGSTYVDIQTKFKDQISDFTIIDVTGWAAPNLLIINAQNNQEDTLVSFWFDIPSQTFIRLGTYFY